MFDAIECPHWFFAWVADYCTTFGIGDELKLAMLRVWWPAFAAAGFAERDFRAAMALLLTATTVPNWPREHLAAVMGALRAARAERTAVKERPAAYTGARCPLCDWTGVVLVPHPTCVREGAWRPPYRTGAVFCRCGPGRRALDAAAALAADGRIREPPMTLDHYELRVDAAWAEHLAERAAATRLLHRAEEATEEIKVSNLTRAVAAGFTMPRERPNKRAAS